jgi:uncharacterized protein (DUF433 family)
MVSVSTEHIVITPGVCGGKPRIAGHRITVQNVMIWHEQMGMSPDEIAATYPSITLADVYAALAYYHDHRDEIDARIKADDASVEEMRANAPPSRLQQILAGLDAQNDPIPPG